jgi:Bardet-Biedl syndrome 2 protein
MLDELHKEKKDCIAELKQFERLSKVTKASDVPVGALPSNTQLTYTVYTDLTSKAIILKVEVNTDITIVNLIAIDVEGVIMLDREVVALSPRSHNKEAKLPLLPSRNVACTIRLQTHLSTRSQSSQLVVQETDLQLPKFAAFAHVVDLTQYPVPKGSVTFTTQDTIERIVDYIHSAFLLIERLKVDQDRMKIGFMSICANFATSRQHPASAHLSHQLDSDEDKLLVFSLSITRASSTSSSCTRVKIYCADMELAADVVQDMAKVMKWTELESEASFDRDFESFEQVLKTVNECNSLRTNLSADMAEESQHIKALIIRAEDSRLMVDMFTMRKAYTDLISLNTTLLNSYQQRAHNHEMLLGALKEVNQMIQKAANLRLGNSKNRVISECRAAVKNNNMQAMLRILQFGYEPTVAPAK